jgi:hypothetical protein
LKVIGKAPRGALYMGVVLALGCLIAACGSGGSSSAGTSSGTTTASAASGGASGRANPARRADLVACLKQHGVTLPSRPPGEGAAGGGAGGGAGGAAGGGAGAAGGGGTGTTGRATGGGLFGGGGAFANNPKLRSAFQACGAQFGFRGGGAFRARLSRATITKYVTCVRQHGYNLPDPNFSGKGPVFPANIRNNAKFQAASRACQSLLVPPRPSSGGTASATGA